MVAEEVRNLVQHLFDVPLFLLVRVQDLQKGLVGTGVIRKPLLDLRHVIDGSVELWLLPLSRFLDYFPFHGFAFHWNGSWGSD